MKRRLTSLVVGATLLGSAATSLAQSPDFTITVPVRLTTLPARYAGGQIICNVFAGGSADHSVGSAQQQFTLDRNVGTLSRDFLFNIRTTIHPSGVRRYECRLDLYADLDGRARLLEGQIEQKFPGSIIAVEGAVPR